MAHNSQLSIQTATQALPANTNNKTTTKRKIGKITYIIESSPCETASETIERKIEGLILRDIQRKQAATE